MNSKKIKFGVQEEESNERNNQQNSSAPQNRRGTERHSSKTQQS